MSDLPDSLAVECLPHKTWTRDEVAVLESTGLFDGTHFELIDGELIDKMGKKRRHVNATKLVAMALEKVFGQQRVDREAPIDIATEDNARNEPEPDVIVLRYDSLAFGRNPQPADLALIVEVADTTLRQDLKTKARLYARAGIPEYWVLDLNGRRLCVFRHPAGGVYQTELECSEDASVATLEKPAHTIAVRSLLP